MLSGHCQSYQMQKFSGEKKYLIGKVHSQLMANA